MVSIRLVSGGHSFSAAELKQTICENSALLVVVDTHRVTLVPSEHFVAEEAAKYLAINGLMPQADEEVVWSNPSADIVAVMAVSRNAKCSIEALFQGEIEWYTPLLDSTHSDSVCCCLEITPTACYVRLYDNNGLRLAEALQTSSEVEILYYITQIFEIEKFTAATPIYLRGNNTHSKTLKKYFKKVICE